MAGALPLLLCWCRHMEQTYVEHKWHGQCLCSSSWDNGQQWQAWKHFLPQCGLNVSGQQAHVLQRLVMEEAKFGGTLWWKKRIKRYARDRCGIGHGSPVMTEVLDPCSRASCTCSCIFKFVPIFGIVLRFPGYQFLGNIKLHASEHVYNVRFWIGYSRDIYFTFHFFTQECFSMLWMEGLIVLQTVRIWWFRFKLPVAESCNVTSSCDNRFLHLFHGDSMEGMGPCGDKIEEHAHTLPICFLAIICLT